MMAHLKSGCRAAAMLVLIGIAGVSSARAQAPASAPVRIDPAWLVVDTATAEVSLIAGLGGMNGGMNFNGATNGALTLVVPVGWHVVLNFRNADPNMPHSAAVIAAATPIPAVAGRPAFAGATTRHADQGLPTGGRETVRFDASSPGAYMIFCAVPGHGMAGMWMRLQVSATARRATLTATAP